VTDMADAKVGGGDMPPPTGKRSFAKHAPVMRMPAGMWRCPTCGQTVSILVNMSAPPACHNHKNGSIALMESVNNKNKKKKEA